MPLVPPWFRHLCILRLVDEYILWYILDVKVAWLLLSAYELHSVLCSSSIALSVTEIRAYEQCGVNDIHSS